MNKKTYIHQGKIQIANEADIFHATLKMRSCLSVLSVSSVVKNLIAASGCATSSVGEN